MRYVKRGLFWRIFGRVAEYSIGAPVQVALPEASERVVLKCKCGCSYTSNSGKDSALLSAWWENHSACWRDISAQIRSDASDASREFDEWWRDHKDKEGRHLTEQQAYTVWHAARNV